MLKALLNRLAPRPEANPDRIIRKEWPDAVYAIGDVHGCLDLLQDLHRQIINDPGAATKLIVMIGDYIDRGPNSAGVLDFLAQPLPPGVERVCLAGNHEAMMLDFLANPTRTNWLRYGGEETLTSYGIDLPTFLAANARKRQQILAGAIPAEHLAFLANRPFMLTLPGYVFVHAGIDPALPLEQQTSDNLLWVREKFYESVDTLPPGDFITVHGHTPAETPVITSRRICIDTGAYLYGKLTAVRLTRSGPPQFLTAQ